MRLDLSTLNVQSFEVSPTPDTLLPSDTGPGGPDSYCYICYETGNTVPSCMGYDCVEPIDPETHFHPCTYNLTCRNCA